VLSADEGSSVKNTIVTNTQLYAPLATTEMASNSSAKRDGPANTEQGSSLQVQVNAALGNLVREIANMRMDLIQERSNTEKAIKSYNTTKQQLDNANKLNSDLQQEIARLKDLTTGKNRPNGGNGATDPPPPPPVNMSALLWQRGESYKFLPGHSYNVRMVEFSPDGQFLASVSKNTVRLWDISTGWFFKELDPVGGAISVRFSPDSQLLAFIPDGRKEVKLWDIGTGNVLGSLSHPDYVHGMDFSPDAKTLVTISSNEKIRIWDVNARAELKAFNGFHAYGETRAFVAYAPDGKVFATIGPKSRNLCIWDAATQFVKELRDDLGATLGSDVLWMTFSKCGQFLASCRGANRTYTAAIWDTKTWTIMARFEVPFRDRPVAFSPDGLLVATISYPENVVVIWETKTRKKVAAFDNKFCQCLAFSPDGQLLAAGADRDIIIWKQSAKLPA
jgi:WD40 repeat protein